MTNILIIDDEPDILEVVSEMIEDAFEGISIYKADSTEEAFRYLQEEKIRFNLIICDFYMSGLESGGEIYKLNEKFHHYPFVFLTGATIEEFSELAELSSGNSQIEVIQKPIDEERLIAIIKKNLT